MVSLSPMSLLVTALAVKVARAGGINPYYGAETIAEVLRGFELEALAEREKLGLSVVS
jgi:hypothetical protein